MLVAKKEVYSYVEESQKVSTKRVKQSKKSNSNLKIKAFGFALLTLAICLGVLFGYAKITQVKMEILKLDNEIVQLKKHRLDISLDLEKIKESGWIEAEAESRLGMMYPTDEQIVYVSVNGYDIDNNNNIEEVNREEKLTFVNLFNNLASKISDKF
ncbi:cell division protein FtsL [Proteiniborus sp. DW1]|uniref:hypothetical protein n=1 Tax=Proteiniborus sp. DW1 TaxID=1889883 RepID=UPI00092E0072|nr:hypothetical protein [Proteiniborus sp. DW1]SCG83204.1 cell division protein FtsL [Proteiniborus sp. DW1]